jgi:hypothetical protein
MPRWRELLSNYRQPLIVKHEYRPRRWINIWSYASRLIMSGYKRSDQAIRVPGRSMRRGMRDIVVRI